MSSKMRFVSKVESEPQAKPKPKVKTQVEVRQEVATRLKAAREAAGYASAEAFCQAHNFPLEKYILHEDAKKSLRATNVIEYAQCLNVDMQWIMIGEPWRVWKEEKEAKEQERGW